MNSRQSCKSYSESHALEKLKIMLQFEYMSNRNRSITVILIAICTSFLAIAKNQAQISSAEERMRRQSLNARPHFTLNEVKANKITLEGQVFLLRFIMDTDHPIEQIEANRWEINLNNNIGEGGFVEAHLPRAGAEALGVTIEQGDVVLARIKPDSVVLTLEIVGVSSLNVWR